MSNSAHRISNTPADSKGFTMIEIISVLIIIGILSAVTVSKMTSTDVYHVVMETETLKGHLRYAQIRAMSHNQSWGISLGTNSYTLQKDGAAAPVNLPNEDSATHTLSNGVSLTPGGQTISFDDFGSPGNADIVSTLSRQGSHARTITITQKTGFIY
jgi:prepilin-type N-terminal cleavage/methylation domain-containing protein